MNEDKEKKRAAAAALFLFRFRPRVTGHVGALHPASPCSTAWPRQQCALKSAGRPFMLASPSRQALALPSGHANFGAFFRHAAFHVGVALPASPCSTVGPRQLRRLFPARGLPCWRRPPGKPLFHRRATPTSAPFSRRAAFHVGVALPASPCSAVGPRQPRRLFPGARPSMLAPCTPQALAPPSGHANPGAFFPARGLPCWRLVPCKPLRLRRATPTPVPRSDLVRARRPAKPMNSVFVREPPAWAREGFGSDCVKQKTQEFPSTSLNEC